MSHALDALLGKWKTTGESIAAAAEGAFSIHGTDEYEWLPGGKFLIHRADVRMGDEQVNVIEVIGPCGQVLEGIPMHAFDSGGEHTLMHASMASASVWRFSNEELRAQLTLHEQGRSMTAHWQRKDGGRWVEWLNMRFEKAD